MWRIIKRIFSSRNKNKIEHNNKILIIENQVQNQSFLQKILSKNYNVLIAENKDSGFKMAKESTPGLIIINAKLSGEKTLDLCARLKDDGETKNIRILIIAENDDNSNIVEYFLQNIDGYLIKPFASNELLHQIQLLIKA